MAQRTASAMDALDIDEFLTGHHTGVLSMARGDDGYAIPVAYAYDETGPAIYFRLGYARDSRKRAFVEAAGRACLVVTEEADAGWRSVVAEGRLQERSGSDLDAAVHEADEGLDIPAFDVHREPTDGLEFAIARLDVDRLSGRVEGR